ncbi:50S ribosomal protein L15e [Candidatus Woesearchaeota archaeon]|nr:50S ribosomal protein L15e [Candidatus Woesearchaeota archaeon]
MGLYKYIRETWNAPSDSLNDITKERTILWRKEPATVRIKFPTRLDRARSLGYRAKQGIFIVRQRITRGGHRKPLPMAGRRPKKWTTRKSLMMNYQTIAEQRASRFYPNCEVLNSYEVAKDGKHYWYEVILVDVSHPSVQADPEYSKIVNQRGRAFRGLTSSARKSRGLLGKGKGYEKMRPSKYANRKRRFY